MSGVKGGGIKLCETGAELLVHGEVEVYGT